MSEKLKRKIFVILFAILYVSVALVSTFHAVEFFGLANQKAVSIMLAITFEIGQAAVLFSILTNHGKQKAMPWVLMCVLTLVQILGNVFSSYEYLITNSTDMLRYFKEPIFVWTELPDEQCNVLLTYIVGAILPVVSLLMTAMVTSFITVKDDVQQEEKNEEPKEEETIELKPLVEKIKKKFKKEKQIEEVKETVPVHSPTIDGDHVEEIEMQAPANNQEKTEQIEHEPIEEEKPKVASHFVNL